MFLDYYEMRTVAVVHLLILVFSNLYFTLLMLNEKKKAKKIEKIKQGLIYF